MSSGGIVARMNTKEQVHQALDAYLDAHVKATDAAAACFSLKSIVGGNETERKAAKAKMSEDEYAAYLEQYNEAELVKVHASAAAERSEKILNTLRELLNSETAETQRAWAEIADRTAMRYAALQMAPPARVVMSPPASSAPDF